jgi:hypothetical protein
MRVTFADQNGRAHQLEAKKGLVKLMQAQMIVTQKPTASHLSVVSKADLIMNVTQFRAPTDDNKTVRIQVQTVSGRIYQHKKSFVADTPSLGKLLTKIKHRVKQANYCVSILDIQWWNDVTVFETKRQLALGYRD